jgi:hypothetical protein
VSPATARARQAMPRHERATPNQAPILEPGAVEAERWREKLKFPPKGKKKEAALPGKRGGSVAALELDSGAKEGGS